jgi:hypothetical protein
MGAFTSPYFVGSLLVQILLVVHCVRTGRNQIWIWILIFSSVVGAAAYIIVELIPDLFRSRTAGQAARNLRKTIDPHQQLRRYQAEAERSRDVASSQRYADELVRLGRAGEAVTVYRQALRGLYEHDPNLLLGLARAQYAAGQPAEARATLDALVEHNPQFKSPDGHLLYARALEGEGNSARALEEYKVLAGYYAGAEAALRYAQLLLKGGHRDQAREVLKGLLDHARLAPRHYQRAQSEWLDQARRDLAAL